MTFHFNRISRFFALFTLLWCIAAFAVACTGAWTGEAINIIQLLVPSITSILSILSAFGVGIPATAMTAIQGWATEATTGLQTVAGLIQQYNTAEATAKPGLLTEIQTTLHVISSNLAAILPEIHVTDPKTEAKITAIIGLVANEIAALINLVPAIQGTVTSHAELKALMAQLKTAKEYRNDFNAAVESFGKEYQI